MPDQRQYVSHHGRTLRVVLPGDKTARLRGRKSAIQHAQVFLDWITGAFIIALPFNVSLYLAPIFRAGPLSGILSIHHCCPDASNKGLLKVSLFFLISDFGPAKFGSVSVCVQGGYK
jgi:hypothetical protein